MRHRSLALLVALGAFAPGLTSPGPSRAQEGQGVTAQPVAPGAAARGAANAAQGLRGGPMDGGTITVTMDGGAQPAFQVVFTAVGPAPSRQVTVFTNNQPQFVLPRALNGEYEVRPSPLPLGYFVKAITADQGLGPQDLLKGTLKVTPTDTTRLVITIGYAAPKATVKVSGLVTGREIASIKAATITLSAGANTFTANIQDDGGFEFPAVPPALYSVALTPSADAFVRTVGVGGQDMADLRIPSVISTYRITGATVSPRELTQQGTLSEVDTLSLALMSVNITAGLGLARGGYELGLGVSAPATGQRGRGNVEVASTPVAPDGTFEFRNISPGPYNIVLRVLRNGAPGAGGGQTGTGVTVVDRDILGVRVNLPAEIQPSTGFVAVDVTVDGSAPRPRFQLRFSGAAGDTETVPADKASFTSIVRAGDRRISVEGLPPGYFAKSIRSGAADLAAQPLRVAADALARVAVTLDVASPAPGGPVRGRLTRAPGSQAATVGLMSSALAETLTAPIREDGSFEFPRVLPGSYTVYLLPGAPSFAQPLTVNAGGMDNLDLDERNERSGGGAESARGPAFVSIQPGEFLMGCDAGARECKEDEKPPRLIRMTKAFEIGKHEVTQGEWQSVMGNNPSNFKGSSRPVENIRWTDAQEFLKRLNARNDGYRYRLPTEAEWEYAARAGGAGPETASVDKHAWHEGNSGFETRPGGQAQPNVWGLHDMLGNVAEWVEDWYGAAFAGAETTDPKGPASGRERVVRGGSWFNQATELRVSARDQLTPDATSDRVGFRIVREAAR